ncbi:MAG: hypothetical protein KQJ78_06505 [Deltaproteobacteria bacterium]|nr:hypothetical protein [Deltaproteobacteria bacterium]
MPADGKEEPQEGQDCAGGTDRPEEPCDCPWKNLKEQMNQYSESDAWQHFSRAQEEFLLGVRALIDQRLAKRPARPQEPAEPRVTRIKLD